MSIHTCSYYCDRPDCVRAQRDELRQKLEQAEKQEPVAWIVDGKIKVRLDMAGKLYYSEANVYAAPVHAIDISQERVDETAKDRHEPESNNVEAAAEQSDNYAAFLAGVRFARVNLLKDKNNG